MHNREDEIVAEMMNASAPTLAEIKMLFEGERRENPKRELWDNCKREAYRSMRMEDYHV